KLPGPVSKTTKRKKSISLILEGLSVNLYFDNQNFINGTMKKLVYVAFLRGINVGGHHKVPMVDLKQTFKKMGLNPIKTVLNSGNILFEADNESTESLEQSIEVQLEKTF